MRSWQDFRKEIVISEGSIPHMYLDTVGKVTVGVGNMLPDVAAAQSLPFVVRATSKNATKDQIKTDFDTVSQQPRGQVASRYKAVTKLDLPENAINTLLDTRIATFKRELKLSFPEFETYPTNVQFALTDMAFNLGTNGVVTKFPKFTKAIKAKDWATAAKESNRPQVNSHRNQTVKAWLETALTDSASLHIDAYGRRWHGSYPFNLTAIRQYAPNSMGVYQILHSKGPAEQVAYIGIATGDTIRGRLTKHASGRGNWALARLGDPASFSFIYFQCDAKTAKQIESHVISTKKPPFNTRPEYRDFIPSIAVH